MGVKSSAPSAYVELGITVGPRWAILSSEIATADVAWLFDDCDPRQLQRLLEREAAD